VITGRGSSFASATPGNLIRCRCVLPDASSPRIGIFGGCISANLLDEIVVVLIGADPKPDDQIRLTTSESPTVISDSGRPNISHEWFELHRWMKRIALPNLKLISCKTLDVRW
jgi:hypothetical protein